MHHILLMNDSDMDQHFVFGHEGDEIKQILVLEVVVDQALFLFNWNIHLCFMFMGPILLEYWYW